METRSRCRCCVIFPLKASRCYWLNYAIDTLSGPSKRLYGSPGFVRRGRITSANTEEGASRWPCSSRCPCRRAYLGPWCPTRREIEARNCCTGSRACCRTAATECKWLSWRRSATSKRERRGTRSGWRSSSKAKRWGRIVALCAKIESRRTTGAIGCRLPESGC